jgi:hypothetical protein
VIAYLPIIEGSGTDDRLRELFESGGTFPLTLGPLHWPHTIATRRSVLAGVATYEMQKVDVCGCGKPMHPLPFDCEDCLAFAVPL